MPSLGKSVSMTLVAALLLVAAVGCGDKSEQAERDSKSAVETSDSPAGPFDEVSQASLDQNRKRHGNLSSSDYEVEEIDLNDDGEADQWVLESAEGTARIERDMNFDGKIDLWQYFDGQGEIVEEEMDLDLDGRIDLVSYYDEGTVRRKAMSVHFDDNFSIVKFYNKDGNLLRVERDEDGDGQPDVWEYYEDGQRQRIGWDQTGDGQPDEFDKLP